MHETVRNICDLERGMIIRHVSGGTSYVVEGNYGTFAIAVRTVHISNPREWIIVKTDDLATAH